MKATLVIAFALFVAISAAPKAEDKLASLMASKGIDSQQIIEAAKKMLMNRDSVNEKRFSLMQKLAARGIDMSELLKVKAAKENMSMDEFESQFAQKVEEKLAKLKSRLPEKYNHML